MKNVHKISVELLTKYEKFNEGPMLKADEDGVRKAGRAVVVVVGGQDVSDEGCKIAVV